MPNLTIHSVNEKQITVTEAFTGNVHGVYNESEKIILNNGTNYIIDVKTGDTFVMSNFEVLVNSATGDLVFMFLSMVLVVSVLFFLILIKVKKP